MHSHSGWVAVFLTICIWTGFILVSRHGGTGTLTSWDIASLRFGVGALIAVFFLPWIRLPPLRVIVLFSVFGGIAYAVAVYAAFRIAPAGHASVLLPGALPFLTPCLWWAGQRPRSPSSPAHYCFLGHRVNAAARCTWSPLYTAIIGVCFFFLVISGRYLRCFALSDPPHAAPAPPRGRALICYRSGGCSCPAAWSAPIARVVRQYYSGCMGGLCGDAAYPFALAVSVTQ